MKVLTCLFLFCISINYAHADGIAELAKKLDSLSTRLGTGKKLDFVERWLGYFQQDENRNILIEGTSFHEQFSKDIKNQTQYTIGIGKKGSNQFFVDFKPLVLKYPDGTPVKENLRYIFNGKYFTSISSFDNGEPSQIVIDHFGSSKNLKLLSCFTPWTLLSGDVFSATELIAQYTTKVDEDSDKIIVSDALSNHVLSFSIEDAKFSLIRDFAGRRAVESWTSPDYLLKASSGAFRVIYQSDFENTKSKIFINNHTINFDPKNQFDSGMTPNIKEGDIVNDLRYGIVYNAGENPDQIMTKIKEAVDKNEAQ
jgi:hypothetical protein